MHGLLLSRLNAREKQLTLTMDKWMIGHQIKGWGLVIPIVVYEPTSVEVTASQYKVLDESGQWQNAGDPIIYNPSIGGYNSFIHLTAGGTYIDGHSYLCTVGMKLS